MKVVITSATEKEIILIKQLIDSSYIEENSKLMVSFHESGIGILSSCFSLSKLILERKPDLIIQAGIAGTFNKEGSLCEVVAVKEEISADCGVEENDEFNDLFDLNLQTKDVFPYFDKKLINPHLTELNYLQLEEVTGITVNEITTRSRRIDQYKTKYNPYIESMEGASLHYCCLQTSIPFIQMRALSNYIGERNKDKWKFQDACTNLANVILLYINQLNKYK